MTAASHGARPHRRRSGGGRGIGRACALALAGDRLRRRHQSTGATRIRPPRRSRAVEALGPEGASRIRRRSTSSKRWRRWPTTCLRDFGGGGRPRALGRESRAAVTRSSTPKPSELERVLATHATAAHHLCRLFVPSMRERPRGDVVFVSSVAARLLAAGRSALQHGEGRARGPRSHPRQGGEGATGYT